MNKKEHQAKHKILHDSLDELIADFIAHTKKFPSKTTIIELMVWSVGQIDNPTNFNQSYEENIHNSGDSWGTLAAYLSDLEIDIGRL